MPLSKVPCQGRMKRPTLAFAQQIRQVSFSTVGTVLEGVNELTGRDIKKSIAKLLCRAAGVVLVKFTPRDSLWCLANTTPAARTTSLRVVFLIAHPPLL